jgi:two-component system response regulator YesN
LLRLLIVEDEKWEREGLVDFLDWKVFGIEIAGTARDGQEGYEKALRLKPDIILTDIKMPGMDGIEMSKKIKEVLPDIKIIILSGYDDFRFAQEAISFNASAYVLKPFEENDLIPVIRKVADMCNKEREKAGWEREVVNRLNESIKRVKMNFLNEWLSGPIAKESLMEKLREFDMSINPDSTYVVVLIKCAGDQSGTLDEAVRWFTEKARDKNYLFLTEDPREKETVICYEWDETVYPMLESINSHIKENYGVSVVTGAGEKANPLNLHVSYSQAREVVKHQLFWNDYRVFRYSEIYKLQEKFMERANEFLVHGDYFSKQFILALSSANEKRVSELLGELFVYINEARGAGTNFIINFVKNIVNDIYIFIYTLHPDFTASYLYEKAWSGCTAEGLKDKMELFLKNVVGMQKNRLSHDEQTVKKVIKIIEERYMEPLSIKTIANEVFLSPNYLGSIFKNHTGKRFNEYLNEYRMEKAKELLKSPKNKVATVAALVGFQNTSYFCSVFKSTFGIAPGEYQKNLNSI